jgi:hypothetical protein
LQLVFLFGGFFVLFFGLGVERGELAGTLIGARDRRVTVF